MRAGLYLLVCLLFFGITLAANGGIDQADYNRYVAEVTAGKGSECGVVSDHSDQERGISRTSGTSAGSSLPFVSDLSPYSECALDRLRLRPLPAARPVGVSGSFLGSASRVRSVDGLLFSAAWKVNVTSTVFWVGEKATGRSPSNERSAWDKLWMEHFGGYDSPEETERTPWYTPKSFQPRENPFYVALPYCDLVDGKFRPEASAVIPWFSLCYRGSGVSVCKDRWVAIYAHGRVAFAQWEDVGPFETDDWAYVFGDQGAPRHGYSQNAGIDVSPAVRSYLGLSGIDKVSWRFVEVSQVAGGPWDGWPSQ
jgi:hypothetical protein